MFVAWYQKLQRILVCISDLRSGFSTQRLCSASRASTSCWSKSSSRSLGSAKSDRLVMSRRSPPPFGISRSWQERIFFFPQQPFVRKGFDTLPTYVNRSTTCPCRIVPRPHRPGLDIKDVYVAQPSERLFVYPVCRLVCTKYVVC